MGYSLFFPEDFKKVDNVTGDIVTDMHLEEMSELFLSFSPQKQQEVINFLKR